MSSDKQEEADETNALLTLQDVQKDSSKGKVHGSLLLHYLRAGGNLFLIFIVFFLCILTQIATSAVDYFVSYWTKIEEVRNFTMAANQTATIDRIGSSKLTTDICIYIYSGLIVALFVIALIRSTLFYKLAMRSSENLHNTMFDGLINTTMKFFDTNPSGRIINRFTKDIGNVDEWLSKSLLDSTQVLLAAIGSVILVGVVNSYFFIFVALISVFLLLLRKIYLKSSKNLKRLEGIMRSPILTHLNATLHGLSTIRANKAQNILIKEFDKHQDRYTTAWFINLAASTAFAFYLDFFCFMFTASVTFSFLVYGDVFFDGGDVGLAITQASSLTGVVQWGIRQSTEVANHLIAVERLLEYKSLPPEKQPIVPKIPPPEWPEQGKIIFRDVGLRYNDNGDLVLNSLNFTIHPKEKIGIVGRTGAGKSSLISAIFRLAQVDGCIEIDGVDTRELSLQVLRSKIAIIPQDPALFSGTLRYNLDPSEEYSDNLLHKALANVDLKDSTETINSLENVVMDRGSNYSVGQRQLICLTRALVRNNKILVLDEATANVDPQTDALIQKTIREKFFDCTVLTIAHRLNTIMDSDRVMVMESGSIIEFEHPSVLLQNPSSKFSKMVSNTDQLTSEQK